MRPIPVRGVLCALLLLLPPLGFLVSRGEARTPSALLSALTGRQNPTASFTFSPSVPQVGQVVTFDGSGSSGSFGGDIATWQWTFHDATTASGPLVTKTYTAPGTYSVWLTVTDFDNLTHTTVEEVTVPDALPPRVTISPSQGTFSDGQMLVVIEWCDETQIDSKSITFNGNPVTSQFTTTVGSQAGCGRYEVSQGTVQLIQGGNVITARASDGYHPATEVQALYTFSPTTTFPTLAPLDSATAIPLIERDLCLTVAAADNASAYECGDLRIVHPLPGVQTMNKQRAPVLLYNSQHAEPNPLVAAHVQFSPTGGQPTAIRATLTVSGTTPAISFSRTWNPPSGTTWAAGQQRRIVMGHDPAISGSDRLTTLPTGVYPYTLSVDVQAGGQWTPQTPLSGSLVVVNRKAHPSRTASILGIPGWWVAGVEELHYLDVNRSQILWVGGDGSARVYTRGSGQTEWTAPRLEWSGDRITSETVGGVTTYVRHLPGGVTVRFNYAGQHVATVNRVGHQTTFEYTSGKLTAIEVPAERSWKPRYQFDYSVTNQVWITGPALEGLSTRVVEIGLSNGRVDYIRDPGVESARPSFGYVGTTNRISQRTDRRSNTTYFTYDEGQKLRSARRQMGPSPSAADIALGFFAHESKGSTRAVRSDSVFTYVKGPRADVTVERFMPATDSTVTQFWIDRFGSPWRIRNTLGHETLVYRGGPELNTSGTQVGTWPARVRRVQAPNGLVTTATYNARGNVDSTTVVSPYGDARNATTRYRYTDANWPDFATRIVTPEKDSVMLGYDSVGNRSWQQDGRGDSTRTEFSFYPNGLLKSTEGPLTPPDLLVYDDDLGNLATVTSPLGFVTTYTRDGVGRVTSVLSPIDSLHWQTQSTEYDLRDRVMASYSGGPSLSYARTGQSGQEVIPAEGVIVYNIYDEEDNLTRVTRFSSPDPDGIGEIVTEWEYDAANRRTVEIAPDSTPANRGNNPREITEYDRAGNVVRVTTRLGNTLPMRYDALNRLVQRVVPEVEYPIGTDVLEASSSYPDSVRYWQFPLYLKGNDGTLSVRNIYGRSPGGSLVLPADTLRYEYDVSGNLTRADNRAARIRRHYYPGGALKADTLWTATYTGNFDPSLHVYGLNYSYDLNGRRTELHHPASLVADTSWMSRVGYTYHPQSGQLQAVTDNVGNNLAVFTYDLEGRLTRTDMLSGSAVSEQMGYDDDGRLVWQHRDRSLTPIQRDTFVYDARGKRLWVEGIGETSHMSYSGLGALAYAFTDNLYRQTDPEETYRTDGLGNTVTVRRVHVSEETDLPEIERDRYRYEPHTGRLLLVENLGEIDNTVRSRERTRFDNAGNQVWRSSSKLVRYPGLYNGVEFEKADLHEISRSYYGADNKLSIVDRRVCAFGTRTTSVRWDCYPPMYNERSTFEEYRYDALGRRVLTRTRQTWACEFRCTNAFTRTVWDGDQVLHEIRAPDLEPEQDTGWLTPGLGNQHFYGRVGYVHGASLDQPLMLVRMNYDTLFPEPQVILPHLNWRGIYESGTFSNGSSTHLLSGEPSRCVQVIENRNDNEPANPEPGGEPGPVEPSDTVNICVDVNWPGPNLWFNHRARSNSPVGPPSWMGSLIENKRDATGQLYMRNRYYDPQTGRFTQEDPIGLAGGINLYGFANGDPVTYSDPYGLTPCWILSPADCKGGDPFERFSQRVRGAVAMGAAYVGLWLSDPATRPAGTDKFYHCLGNCEAAQQGPAGAEVARRISDLREASQTPSGADAHAVADSEADQEANRAGRAAGAAGADCNSYCRTRYIQKPEPRQ